MKSIKFALSVLCACALLSPLNAYYYSASGAFRFWHDGNSTDPGVTSDRAHAEIGSRLADYPPLNFPSISHYGFFASWDSDGVFIGLSDEGPNRKDAVIAWGDDVDDKLRFQFNGADRLRLFSSGTLELDSTVDGMPGYAFSEAGIRKWTLFNANNDSLIIRSGFGTQAIDIFTISNDGKVGIGTTTPTHPLTVNGAIRAKEIIINTGWADDVFASDYRLAPLSEVEQHIKAKGHLPAVPSAAEVAEKGISVGESQAMLLRKVEELTLHVIALNKQVQAQQKRLAELEAPQVQVTRR
jgi:hypothetical protein